MDALKSEKGAAEDLARTKDKEEKKDRKATDQEVANAGKKWNESIRKRKELIAELDAHLAILEKREKISLDAIHRTKHVMAKLQLRIGKKEEALTLSQQSIDETPNQTLPLAARVALLHECGETAKAREAFTKLQSIWSAAPRANPRLTTSHCSPWRHPLCKTSKCWSNTST